MVNQLGKILRIVRINTGDSMRTMAEKLGLSVSYLSAIENGKRNVPGDLESKIISKYNLSDKDKKNLREAINATTEKVKVDLTELSAKKKKLVFAITKDQIDEDTLQQLCAIIDKNKENK